LPPPETTVPGAAYHSEAVIRVADVPFKPRGLAYDAVSSRFVVADPSSRKLVILDERSHRAVDLVRASSAGFSDIAAFEIDERRGDLWVLSAGAAGGGEGASPVSLHKLQLVSGRQLASFLMPPELVPAQFRDIAVTPTGTVLMLDELGSRIIAFDPAEHRFTAIATLEVSGATSIAPADDRSVYVACSVGIAHVDLSTGRSTLLGGRTGPATQTGGRTNRHRPAVSSLGGFERIRWARGVLVGIQRQPDGNLVAVQVKVSARHLTAEQIVDSMAAIADPTAVTFSGSDFYVLTRGGTDRDGEIVIERIRLK